MSKRAYYFSEDIARESVNKLLEFCNNCPTDKTNVIYLTSSGGDIYSANVLLDYFNKNSKKIELIAVGFIESSAFDVFFKSQCKKIILKPTSGMVHLSTLRIRLNSKNTFVDDSDKYGMKNMEITIKEDMEFYNKLGITNKEIKRIQKGEDVYFELDRMVEFLNK